MAPDITLVRVRAIRDLRSSEESHKNSEKLPVFDAKDWPKNIETLQEYLRAQTGETGIPLGYVIRVDENVGVDPPGGYASIPDEMIARAPHRDDQGFNTPAYQSDRLRVWELISETCRGLDCWTYVKSAQRTRDGRLAYQNLFNNYLGPNNVDNMAKPSEKKLQVTRYTGETKRWIFESYVRLHVDQHAILTGLVDHGYSGIDNQSKVRHLMDGIKTKELDSVKTQILASALLRNDFDSCVNLYKDFISQMKSTSNQPELNISSVGKEGILQYRYYTKDEYDTLSPEQKSALRDKRKARGHKRGEKSPGQGDLKRHKKNEKKNVTFGKGLDKLTRSVNKMANAFAKHNIVTSDTESETAEPAPAAAPTNRSNPALTRQQK